MSIRPGRIPTLAALVFLSVLVNPSTAPLLNAQDAQILVSSTGEISPGYESYSLFLICNPTWLLADSQPRLLSLYRSFEAFGRAIGESHLAVWFFKTDVFEEEALAEALDVDRSLRYCVQYELEPQNSPHILVLTSLPDPSGAPQEHAVIRLGGLQPGDIDTHLEKLTGDLLLGRLETETPGSRNWWRAFETAFRSARCATLSIAASLSLTIETAGVQVEVAPSGSAADCN